MTVHEQGRRERRRHQHQRAEEVGAENPGRHAMALEPDYDSDPDAVRLGFDPDAARAEVAARIGPWNAIGRELFGAWLAAAARVRSPA